MNARRVQSINPNDPMALQKVIEALEVSEGIRGKAGDRKPTITEVKEMLSGAGASSASQSTSTGSSVGATPKKPNTLAIKELLDSIVISWAPPGYEGHSSTEIYRATTDLLSSSVFIGYTSANYYIDWAADPSETYYYFVRHKNVFSLGGKTGPYANSISGARIQADVSGGIKSGAINTTAAKAVSFGTVKAGRSISISLQGTFFSTINYDDVGLALLAEMGNAVSIEVRRNGVLIDTITPIKIQSSHADADGQIKYLYFLQVTVADTSVAGNLDYTLTATRIFPSNTDSFELYFSAHLI